MAQTSVLSLVDIAKAPVLAYNDKNFDKIRETVTQGVVYEEVATGRKVRGVNEVLNVFRAWSEAIPAKATILKEYVVGNGNTVVLELTWSGTHTGPLQTENGEIAPTGKKVNVQACQIVDIADDKVTSVRHYFDMNTLLRQVGALPTR